MQYKNLGKSNLQISEITFGCMSLEEDQHLANKLISKAIDHGINVFDTADLYQKGYNEEMLGTALLGKRKEVIIATKVGNQLRSDGSGWDWNPSKEYIFGAVEQSLTRLQTDYIDLYQLHGGTADDPIDETIEAFELLKSQGKIREYGISSIRPNVILEYIKRSGIASNMMQYSLLDRRPEEACFSSLNEAGIGVLARGTLAQGILAGKPKEEYLGYNSVEIKKIATLIDEVAQKYQMSNACIATRFALQNVAVTSVVVGIRTEKHLDDFLTINDKKSLIYEDWERLNQINEPNIYNNHR